MKHVLAPALAAGAIFTAAMGFTVQATAAPAGPSNVTDTVATLEADGYNVIVNRTGAAPLSACAVRSVRPGQQVTRTDNGFPGGDRGTVVVSKTVYVYVAC